MLLLNLTTLTPNQNSLWINRKWEKYETIISSFIGWIVQVTVFVINHFMGWSIYNIILYCFAHFKHWKVIIILTESLIVGAPWEKGQPKTSKLFNNKLIGQELWGLLNVHNMQEYKSYNINLNANKNLFVSLIKPLHSGHISSIPGTSN